MTNKMPRRTHFELRAAMRETGIKQSQLARAMGVRPVTIWRWVNAKADIPGYVWTIMALFGKDKRANILKGMPKEWIIEEEDVFPNDESYRDMVKMFHPDKTGKDTALELAVISEFKNYGR
jgi:transcriptional regulator with XRE-family HTH domain